MLFGITNGKSCNGISAECHFGAENNIDYLGGDASDTPKYGNCDEAQQAQ